LDDYERVLANTPACLMGLLMPYKQRVEQALRPALTTHSWLSVGISDCASIFLASFFSLFATVVDLIG